MEKLSPHGSANVWLSVSCVDDVAQNKRRQSPGWRAGEELWGQVMVRLRCISAGVNWHLGYYTQTIHLRNREMNLLTLNILDFSQTDKRIRFFATSWDCTHWPPFLFLRGVLTEGSIERYWQSLPEKHPRCCAKTIQFSGFTVKWDSHAEVTAVISRICIGCRLLKPQQRKFIRDI